MGVNRKFSKGFPKARVKADEVLCSLCEFQSDEPYLGQLLTHLNVHLHENCLYFSPVLNQKLDPSVKRRGYLLGFKLAEIEEEVKRINRLKCCVCKKRKAGIGCCHRYCRKSFHLECGLKHNAMGIFTDSFQFYCSDHAELQDLTKQIALCKSIIPECTICLDLAIEDDCKEQERKNYKNDWTYFLDKIKRREIIHGTCCTRSWMHKRCMSRYGLSAGLHHVKCPNCSNTDLFIRTVQNCGIWLPDRDASWELEPGAFQEMYDDSAIDTDERVVVNLCNSSTSSIHNSDTQFNDSNDLQTNDENQSPLPVRLLDKSLAMSSERIQTEVCKKYGEDPKSHNATPLISSQISRKRIHQNELQDLPVVPVKRRRKSNTKQINISPLVNRKCTRCTKAIVCFSLHNKSNHSIDLGADADSKVCLNY